MGDQPNPGTALGKGRGARGHPRLPVLRRVRVRLGAEHPRRRRYDVGGLSFTQLHQCPTERTVMRALTIHAKLDIREEDVPTPEPGPDQVRVRMAYAGVCGSDLHYYFEGANGAFVVRERLIPGHEVSGLSLIHISEPTRLGMISY